MLDVRQIVVPNVYTTRSVQITLRALEKSVSVLVKALVGQMPNAQLSIIKLFVIVARVTLAIHLVVVTLLVSDRWEQLHSICFFLFVLKLKSTFFIQ